MQSTKSIPNFQEKNSRSSIQNFIKRFNVGKILRQSKISKIRGYSVLEVLTSIMQLPFIHKNFYQGIVKNKDIEFNKSVAYDFLNNRQYNWRLFLLKVVAIVIRQFIKPLTNQDRQDVLIIDDTSYPRNRSKCVELLANVFDHANMKFFRGFRIMQLGWSDGNSFLPVDFALLSSTKKKNRYQEMDENINKRSRAYQRRLEAITKQTDLIVPMIKRAFSMGIKAKYLLMDSWYGFPSVIIQAKALIDVICMVKKTTKINYYLDNKKLTLMQIYKQFRKRRGKANIKGSQLAEIESDGKRISVKIVFVRNRSKKKDWLAILSTDIELTDEEIVRIYGKRWDIEVFFKMTKQLLRLNNEIQARSFDSMIAHISIVMLRYIFIATYQRESVDDKTFGGIFLELIDEITDITLKEAIIRIINITINIIDELFDYSEEMINVIFEKIMRFSIEKFGLSVEYD